LLPTSLSLRGAAISKYYIRLIKVDLRSGNVNICIYRSAIKNLKFGSITPLYLYKLPNLDKRAVSGAVSVYIYPASGQRAVQLVQSVSEARWTLTVGHTKFWLHAASNTSTIRRTSII